MISENTYSSQTKLIGLNLPIREHRIGYSNLTPDPPGARGAPGVKIQVSPNQKTSLTKVVRHDKGMIKILSAPPEELGKPAKRVSQQVYNSTYHTSQNGQQWFFFVSPNFDLKFIILHIKPFQNHFKNENIFSYSNFMADQSFSYIKLQWMRKKMFLIGQF